jgi:hypothetical protein
MLHPPPARDYADPILASMRAQLAVAAGDPQAVAIHRAVERYLAARPALLAAERTRLAAHRYYLTLAGRRALRCRRFSRPLRVPYIYTWKESK